MTFSTMRTNSDITNRLLELKTTDKQLSEQAAQIARILREQERLLVSAQQLNANELALLQRAIKHYECIARNATLIEPQNPLDAILNYDKSHQTDISRVIADLILLKSNLTRPINNKCFTEHAASCCWIANHYIELMKLSSKFQLSDNDRSLLNRFMITPAQRLPRLVLIFNTLLDDAKKYHPHHLGIHIVLASLLSRFILLAQQLNSGIQTSPDEDAQTNIFVTAIKKLFAPFKSAAPFLDLEESTRTRSAVNDILATSVTQESTGTPSIQTLQESLHDESHPLTLSTADAADLSASVRSFDAIMFNELIKEINQYLTDRAHETSTSCFCAFFGKSGQDYYDRRAHWTNILADLGKAATSKDSNDLVILNRHLLIIENYFRGVFGPARFSHKLDALRLAILNNPQILQDADVQAYITRSQQGFRTLNKLTIEKVYEVIPDDRKEFLSYEEAVETEAINQASGSLRVKTHS